MDRKFLQDLGLEKEAIDSIMAEAGKEKNEFLAQIGTLQSEKNELDKKLGGFKDYEDIKKQLEDTKAEYEGYKKSTTAENEKHTQALNSLKLSHAIALAVEREHSIDATGFKAHLDESKISLDENGKLVGYEEQSKAIHENQPYLFNAQNKPSGAPSGNMNPSGNRELTWSDAIDAHYED